MVRFLVTILLFALSPFVAQAQEDWSSGKYEDAETMRADQAIVRKLMSTGADALEQGRWTVAREACGELNAHLYNSNFMNEPANKAASEFGLACYADAQAQLGDSEAACRVYARIDYRGLLEGLDRREICRATANPAPPTYEERYNATSIRLGEQMAQMFAMDTLIGGFAKDNPLRAEKRAELLTLCNAMRVSVSPYEDLSAGVFYFCKARWNHHWGDDDEACKNFNVVDVKFAAVGMTPWPRWARDTSYLDRMVSEMTEIKRLMC